MKEMKEIRQRRRLLDDYIIPSLNSGKYGEKLYWLIKEKGIFRIYWSHKNAAKWKANDTIVFQDWDRMKGHFKPEGKNYFMCAKQRFRAALYKLSPYVRLLKCPEKFHRDYQLISDGNRRKSENMGRSKTKTPKRANQSAIPTSVICKNTSYIEKPASKEQTQNSLSPNSYVTPTDSQVLARYTTSMVKHNQLKMSRNYENMIVDEEINVRNTREFRETSVLRENSLVTRIPHIAPQPVPVYCSFKLSHGRQLSIQESPIAFVSKVYSGPENVPQMKGETQSSVCNCDGTDDGILNLSLKSDASDTPSR